MIILSGAHSLYCGILGQMGSEIINYQAIVAFVFINELIYSLI